MKTQYSFTIVRYVHDVVGGEFVNVGVVLYAPDQDYVDAMCTKKYGRLSNLFIDVDGAQFRSLMHFLEVRIDEARQSLQNELQFDGKPKDVSEIVARIIPKDDSSFQFSTSGSGLTADPQRTVEELFERYVERYAQRREIVTRDDQEIWKTFKAPLEQKRVVKFFHPHQIVARDYDYEFEHACKNSQWHVLEPVSFDLESSGSIKDKAARWLGRSVALQTSREQFKLFLLLGKPRSEQLLQAYTNAENILNRIPVDKVLVREEEADSFASSVESDIARHSEG